MDNGRDAVQNALDCTRLQEIRDNGKVELPFIVCFRNQGILALQIYNAPLATDNAADLIASFEGDEEGLEADVARDACDLETWSIWTLHLRGI